MTTPPSFDDVAAWITGVDVDHRFLQVDEIDEGFAELARRHPSTVHTRRVGTSRLGEPLLLTTVGAGSRDALVVAGVHPNEVTGFRTAESLARLVVDDERFRARYDYSWHFLHNLDPDGVRLNETWFDRPGDFDAYARGFFRPAPEEQPEWTFPTDYKDAFFDRMLPETQALARVIDGIRPELYVSLHNSESGGAYWYVSQWDAQLVQDLHRVSETAGVIVDRGEAESPHLTALSDGVFLAPRFAAEYDAAEAAGENPAQGFLGSQSVEYAAARGAVTLIPEVPYWSPAAPSTAETDEPHSAMIDRTARELGAVAERLEELRLRVRPSMTVLSPFWLAAEAFLPFLVADARADSARADASASDRSATVAETVSRETRVRGFILRYGGMFRRALQTQVDAGLADPAVREATAEVTALVEEWLNRSDAVETEMLPVRAMVGQQLGSILVVADEIARRRG